MDNKRYDWFKTLKYENFESGKPISIQVDLQFFRNKMNIAAVTDAWYKLLLEKHNNPDKKREILCKIIHYSKFFEKFKLHLKEHD